MGAQFVTLRQSQAEPDGTVLVAEHWYLTEDKARVVREGDPDGRWLWASPGTAVPRAEALRLGALEAEVAEPDPEPTAEPESTKPEVEVSETEAPAEPEPVVEPASTAKARSKPADKSRKPAGDK